VGLATKKQNSGIGRIRHLSVTGFFKGVSKMFTRKHALRFSLGSVALVVAGAANAAVDAAITTAITTMATDAATVASAVLVAIIGVVAIKFIRKGL